MKKVIISIEASNLIERQPTGIPKYSKALINNLLNIPDFNLHYNLSLLLAASRWKNRQLCPHFENVQKQWFIKRFLFNRKVELIHYTGVFHNHYRRIPKIITIHDIAVLKLEHNIPFYTSRETIKKTRENMDNISKNINAIIFVSETSRRDFLNLYSFPEKQTFVVYPGSNYSSLESAAYRDTGILGKYNLRARQYFLYLGGISIRKNVLNLVKAFNLFKDKSDFDLVLVGNNGMGAELIFEEIQKSDKKGQIKCTGFVTDSEIIDLYKNASAFVFPTYYEGFGVPIIDAMNFKIPVLIGNKGAAPEISKGFATEVNPFDVESISNGFEMVLKTSNEILVQAKDHAKDITWKSCAQGTLDVYKTFS